MRNRTLLVGAFPTWDLHHVWQLALAQAHAAHGDELFVFSCAGARIACEANYSPSLDKEVCVACIKRRHQGLKTLWRANVDAKPIVAPNRRAVIDLPRIEDISALKVYTRQGMDAGLAALSSWIELSRRTTPESVEDWDQINILLKEAVSLHAQALAILRDLRPTQVGIFNGRLVSTRPWVRACEATGTPFYCYDHGPSFETVRRFDNTTVHSISGWQRACQEFWEQRPSDEFAEDVAERFYSNRRERKDGLTSQFLKNQKTRHVPGWWAPDARWLAVFLSSDDEFAAIGEEWTGGVYTDQWAGVQALCSDPILRSQGFRFVVRVHPRLQFIQNTDWLRFSAMQGELNAIIIAPSDPTDSYELAALSEKTLSFGSSMGIEAAYMGRPSILLGPSFYAHLGACYQPTTHEQVVDLLMTKDLPARERTGAVQFGYFLASAGEDLPGIEKTTDGEITFRGLRRKNDLPAHFPYALPWRLQRYLAAHPRLDRIRHSIRLAIARTRFSFAASTQRHRSNKALAALTNWKRA
jgi:hypothetical protein